MDIYRVRRGDTIWQIAQRYGVTPQSIIEVNGLTQPEHLVMGMHLVIPTMDPRFGTMGTLHTVQENETLWSISQRYAVSISQVVAANGLSEPFIVSPGQRLVVPVQQQQPVETLGYINPGIVADPGALVREIGPYLTYLGLFEFPITPTGGIEGTVHQGVVEAAREVNARVLPVLTNIDEEGFNPDIARAAIADPGHRENLITNTLTLLNQYDFIGVIIDLENLYPEDRALFTQFIGELSAALHQQNKILVLNLAAKWEDWPDRPWVGFFDYEALGPLVDRAAIMTYEWGYVTGPPDPTAPIPNVRRVLDYAIDNNIPPGKILMGMTLYGYNWEIPDTPENLATTTTLPQVWELARRYNGDLEFHEAAGQPSLTYRDEQGRTHIVWFEDARSHYLKYQLVREYQLRGVFYWIISMPFPATYYMVSRLFRIVKL